MIGSALGVVGLSLDDTLRLTPEEFGAVYEEWKTLEDARRRVGWEQARFISYSNLMPYSKKGFTLQDVVQFDWETENKKEVNVCSREDFERIQALFGG